MILDNGLLFWANLYISKMECNSWCSRHRGIGLLHFAELKILNNT